MKRQCLLILAAILGWQCASSKVIKVDTENTSLVVDADKGKKLKHLYYGTRITDTDAAALRSAGSANLNAYPDYGVDPSNEAAIAAVHNDGNMTLNLLVDNVTETDNGDSRLTTVTLRDDHYPFTVDVNYRTYPGLDIIETWTDISHREKKPVTLTRFASGYLPVRYGNVWLSNLYGSWGNEARLDCQPLAHGMKVIKNRDGVRNSATAHSELMLSLDGQPRENSGRVIGAALCYDGNYRLAIDTDASNYHHFTAGIDEDQSEYHLKPGEVFTTPVLALSYSNDGLGGVSRNFHRWGREKRIAHGDKLRDVLLNSWEGVYFDIKEPEMDQMMADIASMGGELFVMDDGWFGVKYPRDNATQGLGDWTVDTRKLPGGINGLLESAKRHGVKFGIWIEPEMVNTKSELFEKHPEYVIKAPNRELHYGRGKTQMILDMSNPKVQDIVFTIVDTLLTKYPEIAYIKWDANMQVRDHGSQYLPAADQSHMFIDYHKGLHKTLDRIRAKYPDVVIQACASGGGRANYGFLPWFDEFWVSDNTDALQRVYIQWGTSYFYPALAMASHISAAPNHQTKRTMNLKYRTDVAMSGRLGMEIQPQKMTAAEREQCRKAINEYKQIRPIIQQGDLYRLLSPYDGLGAASLLYATPAKDKAVYFWWKTEAFRNKQYPRVKMDGLDPDKTYKVTELNRVDPTKLKFEGKSFTGRYLMDNGLEMPVTHTFDGADEWASRVLLLTAE